MVVLLVAWWFLIVTPMRDDAAAKEAEYQNQKTLYDQNLSKVQRIDQERSAARQASSDLLSLDKLIPADTQVPSMIIELQATANEAGLKFMKIVPDVPVAGTGGGTVIPVEINVQGQIFDVNDFLYRVENYARMDGNDVSVTGRLISVVTVDIVEPQVAGEFPDVLVKLGANAYMTGAPSPSKTAQRAASNDTAASSGPGGG